MNFCIFFAEVRGHYDDMDIAQLVQALNSFKVNRHRG